jgi:hypothetical protein
LKKTGDFTTMANIASNLEQLSKEQLISLMVQMVQLYPDLEELIKTISLPSVIRTATYQP